MCSTWPRSGRFNLIQASHHDEFRTYDPVLDLPLFSESREKLHFLFQFETPRPRSLSSQSGTKGAVEGC